MILLENKKESQVLLDYDHEKEYWRPVPGYEKLYEVSSKGNLMSLNYWRSGEPALLRPDIRKGYLGVTLYAKRKTSKILHIGLHRLVALAFIHNPNPEKFTQVNHKDEVKTNNDFRNLEWCDSKYNNNYGTGKYRAIQSYKETLKAHPEIVQERAEKARKLYKENPELWEPAFAAIRKPVNQYTKDGKLIKTWKSAADAARDGGFNSSHIRRCCNGKYKSHRGYIWKFAEGGE